jgi:hypothetical protein
VQELEQHPLDQYEYLGALQARDAVEQWIQTQGDQATFDGVEAIDYRFEVLTAEDDRFAARFTHESGPGWWWMRLPADPSAQEYLVKDWAT